MEARPLCHGAPLTHLYWPRAGTLAAMRRRLLLLTSFLLCGPPVAARDLGVFSLQRLDLPSPEALSSPREGWSFDARLGHQNTWSMSPNVQDYFETRGVRRQLGAADIAEVRALPGEKFLVDLEVSVLDFTLQRRIDERWSAYAIVGAVSYGGGFMDGPIERYHDAFGFREYVRGAAPRNGFTVVADTGRTHFATQDAPSAAVLDPVLGVRYHAGAYAFDAAVKVPLEGRRDFVSNGAVDFGVQASWRQSRGSHTGYASASVVSTRGGGIIDTTGRRIAPSAGVGYRYEFGQGTGALVEASLGAYGLKREDTGLDGLRKHKGQVAFGLQHRAGRSTFSVRVLEAFAANNGLPDLGFQVGWTVE